MSLEQFLKHFGKNIARARKSLAVTQKAAASELGISYRYYQSIESGSANITLTTLYRLALFLKTDPSQLFHRESAP